MPISGPASFVSTTQEFIAHWGAADATLGTGNEVILPGNVARAALDALYNSLLTKRAAVQAKLNLAETSRGDVENRKTALLLRLDQFNEKVRATLPGSQYMPALPNLPGSTEGQGNIVEPLDDAASLWLQINADPAIVGPLKLLGNYLQAQFNTDIEALKAAYKAAVGAGTILNVTRNERNAIQDQIYTLLKAYRQNLPTYFAKDDALVTSLPRLSPLPGSTPDAVTATATYDQVQHKAHVTWTESDANDLAEYRVAYTIGPVYSTDDEQFIGTILPGAPREFFTDTDLAANGNIISLKVYVITASGHEKGSNAVTVTRVEAPPPTGP